MTRPNKLPLYTLFATMFLSVTGNVLASIAIPWFVLKTTGSATQTGITAFFNFAPMVIATFLGGTLIDRVGYRRISIIADVASGVTILLIPLLYTTVGLEFWQLLALVFLGTLLDTPGYSARSAMIPELAEAAGMSLDRATSINSVLRRATTLVGGFGAGLLLATVGEVNLLWIDAATFFISAAAILLFIPSALVPTPPQQEDKAEQTSYWQDLREGLRFVRGDGVIMLFIFVVMLTNMVDIAMLSVGLPVYLEAQFGAVRGATLSGVILGTVSAAAVVTTALWGWKGDKLSRRWVFTLGFILGGLRFFVLMGFPPLWGLLLTYLITGIVVAPLNPIIAAVMYERTPKLMRGRVFGILNGGVTVAMPLGVLVTGVLLEQMGIRATLLLFGAIYMLTTVSLLFNRTIGAIDTTPPPDDTAIEPAAQTA